MSERVSPRKAQVRISARSEYHARLPLAVRPRLPLPHDLLNRRVPGHVDAEYRHRLAGAGTDRLAGPTRRVFVRARHDYPAGVAWGGSAGRPLEPPPDHRRHDAAGSSV